MALGAKKLWYLSYPTGLVVIVKCHPISPNRFVANRVGVESFYGSVKIDYNLNGLSMI